MYVSIWCGDYVQLWGSGAPLMDPISLNIMSPSARKRCVARVRLVGDDGGSTTE